MREWKAWGSRGAALEPGLNVGFGLILLKNTCLIVGTATDSILSTTGRIGDDGTETGSAGGFVLRVLA